MSFWDGEFQQQMQALGLSSTMAPSLATGKPVGEPSYTPFAPPPSLVPPLHPYQASSAAPAAQPYAQYGGPEKTYFTGNTLQNFGWPGQINTANQAATAPAAAPASTASDSVPTPDTSGQTGGNGNMATGGRVVRKRRAGALNAFAGGL